MKREKVEIYKAKDASIELRVRLENESVWLSQSQMVELFGRTRVAITQHIGNIFKEGELEEELVSKDFLHTTEHGAIKRKSSTKYYNPDMII